MAFLLLKKDSFLKKGLFFEKNVNHSDSKCMNFRDIAFS